MPELTQSNPYNKTEWIDHIVDPTLPESDPNRVVQQGTGFTARRANNIEEGIFSAHHMLTLMSEEINRIRAEIEMLGRAPINNGSFLDVLDGTNERNLTPLKESAVAQVALSAGGTSITMDKAPFAKGSYVTIYDNANSEDVKVVAVAGNTITVSDLANAYKKGAVVAYSNTVTKDEKLSHGTWSTFGVTMTEVV